MENIRAVISHPSSCWCRTAPPWTFSCTLFRFVLNFQSHKPSSSAYDSSIHQNLISRGIFSVKLCLIFFYWIICCHCLSSISSSDVLVVGVCFVLFFKFGARHFCFLKSQLLLSWGKRLSEDLATFAKLFPLDRKQQACKSPNVDRFLDSKSAETSQECSGEVLQVLASCKLNYFPDAFGGDLMQKQNLSCCLLHPMGPSHQPCWAGWADCAKRVWKYEAMEVSCAREVDVFCPSAQAPCAKSISPRAAASCVLSEIWVPFTPCASGLVPVPLSIV